MSLKATLKTSPFIFSLFLFGVFLSMNICNAQYLPFGYGTPYGTYGSGLGTQNIPIITPFMRTYVDPINFYTPYGYGTNSSSPYLMSGFYPPPYGGIYGGFYPSPYGGMYGGFYGAPYGGMYGGFYGPNGGIYGGPYGPYGLGGFGFPWFF